MEERHEFPGEEERLDLGWLEVCFKVTDLEQSLDFYRKLDFMVIGVDRQQGWAVLENEACRIALYQGHIDKNLLNFRGGDVYQIATRLKERGVPMAIDATEEPDGSVGAVVVDPDGNIIYFNTHPEELR
ncbi:MAG: VOC family protein [bacterium]